MSKSNLILSVFLICTLLVPLSALEVPPLSSPVVDTAGMLTASEKQELEDYLLALDHQTGVQIAVLTIPSLQGESLEAFSMKTAETWKLGQQGEDNGALLLVALEERAIRIEAGYGLESTLTDAKSGLIIRQVLAPLFRAERYGQGIIEAVRNMAGIATGNEEILSEKVRNSDEDKPGGNFAGLIFFILFFLLMRGGLGRRGGLLGALFLGSMLGGRRGGSSGFGGGFGGGGFSGGGGGFGGGGASGGW